MPDCAAHYQFGQDVLSRLGADLRACALAYKPEFDVGLQGPDIFFFFKPYRKNDVLAYGSARHDEPGFVMFRPMLNEPRQGASLAYLMGLICHYTLDACCHPYVYGHSHSLLEHHRMEAAYDRHIISRRGLPRARHAFLPTTGLDYEAMAGLWPGRDGETLRKCVRAGRFYTWLLDHAGILRLGELVAGRRGEFSAMSPPGAMPADQREHARVLDALYEKALGECPGRIDRAMALMGTELKQGQGFDRNHKGERGDGHEQAGEGLDTL